MSQTTTEWLDTMLGSSSVSVLLWSGLVDCVILCHYVEALGVDCSTFSSVAAGSFPAERTASPETRVAARFPENKKYHLIFDKSTVVPVPRDRPKFWSFLVDKLDSQVAPSLHNLNRSQSTLDDRTRLRITPESNNCTSSAENVRTTKQRLSWIDTQTGFRTELKRRALNLSFGTLESGRPATSPHGTALGIKKILLHRALNPPPYTSESSERAASGAEPNRRGLKLILLQRAVGPSRHTSGNSERAQSEGEYLKFGYKKTLLQRALSSPPYPSEGRDGATSEGVPPASYPPAAQVVSPPQSSGSSPYPSEGRDGATSEGVPPASYPPAAQVVSPPQSSGSSPYPSEGRDGATSEGVPLASSTPAAQVVSPPQSSAPLASSKRRPKRRSEFHPSIFSRRRRKSSSSRRPISPHPPQPGEFGPALPTSSATEPLSVPASSSSSGRPGTTPAPFVPSIPGDIRVTASRVLRPWGSSSQPTSSTSSESRPSPSLT